MSDSIERDEVAEAMERVRLDSPDGKLQAASVVEAAADESSPLHGRFCWDDARAAHQFRLVQARELIASAKMAVDRARPPAPQYVSLLKDRTDEGGGYRHTGDVLASDDLRRQMMDTAGRELDALQSRYDRFAKLTGSLTASERAEFLALEKTMERNLPNFIAVARALTEVRDKQLYRGTHETFEAYCADLRYRGL